MISAGYVLAVCGYVLLSVYVGSSYYDDRMVGVVGGNKGGGAGRQDGWVVEETHDDTEYMYIDHQPLYILSICFYSIRHHSQ